MHNRNKINNKPGVWIKQSASVQDCLLGDGEAAVEEQCGRNRREIVMTTYNKKFYKIERINA
jgi:hypothetical protein